MAQSLAQKRFRKFKRMKNWWAYQTWFNMKERCYNPTHIFYKYYGGRGIKVCNEWLNSFDTFLNDMGNPPIDPIDNVRMTLDKIDNDKDYSKLNCKWNTRWEQVNNRRERNVNISRQI